MARVRHKKGTQLLCVACAREVIISNQGISRTTLWCCGRPMKKGRATRKKATTKKPAKKKK